MTRAQSHSPIIGILLAAGRGERFADAAAGAQKLLAPAPPGTLLAGMPIALAALHNLRGAVDLVLAVTRAEPSHDALREQLANHGCRVLSLPAPHAAGDAGTGMGWSIAHAVRNGGPAQGWVIALADMPAIAPQTVAAVARAIAGGAACAAPYFDGRRGHPVGWSAAFGADLAALAGDAGARELLARCAPERIAVDDPGILLDIDTPADLERWAAAARGIR